MRAAVAFHNFASPRAGGSQESLHTLLSGLSRNRDLSIDGYQTPPVDSFGLPFEYEATAFDVHEISTFSWTNQMLVDTQWRRHFLPVLENECYDILIAQNKLAPSSILLADNHDIPSIFFIRSLWETGWGTYDPKQSHLANFRNVDLGGRIQYPFLVWNMRRFCWAMRVADIVIANSEFVRDALAKTFDIDSTVIYPPIELDAYEVEYDPDGTITMVNPRTEAKGGNLFLDLAELMPEEQFLLVGPTASSKQQSRAESLSNVEYVAWADDVRKAYRRSKVVVVPSNYPEPFGRVAAEAMASGIPTVVSERGGLPEVVGDAGTVVSKFDSAEAWREAILREIETNNPEQKIGRVRSNFSAERQIESFVDLVDRILFED